MKDWIILKSILFSVIIWHSVCASQKPNIIFILADDYGFNDIGYHGSEIKTPHLDDLAKKGVKLENYYVQPICSPTRSQLISGRYQIHTGLQHGVIRPLQPNCLPTDIPTIANKLKEQDYKTHVVGKWHLGFYKRQCMPLNRGFDSHYGFLVGAQDYYTHRRNGYYDLRDNFDVVWGNTEYSTHLFTRKAQEKIKAHDKDKPLFMYVAYQAVHGPLQVPEKYTKPYDFIANKRRRTYAGMVSAMDEGIGNLTETLKSEGLWNNTIIIFSTDNGGTGVGNNYPLRGKKGTHWEGGVRGIGFVHSPLLSRSGVKSTALVHVSDWFPTLLKLAGGNTDNLNLDGHNVWDAINDGSPSPRTEILHNIDPLAPKFGKTLPDSPFDVRIKAALRVGDWKLLTGNPGKGRWDKKPDGDAVHSNKISPEINIKKNLRLFNVNLDPEEVFDVSDLYPTVVKQMLTRLAFYNSTAVPVVYPPPDLNGFPNEGEAWGPWK